MARKDDGEFELVLGNRQLVSVFLIVVILLGVFFSMGYIVGRSSSSSADNGGKIATAKPIIVENPSHPAALPEEPASTPPSDAQSMKPAPSQPVEKPPEAKRVVETQPALDLKPAEAKHTTPKLPEPEPIRTANVGEPAPGQYLQVVATGRPDAEIVAESLLKKGFKAMVSPVPGSALHRVLVGPFRDAADLSDTRGRLEAAGFKPYVRKY